MRDMKQRENCGGFWASVWGTHHADVMLYCGFAVPPEKSAENRRGWAKQYQGRLKIMFSDGLL
ncbi:hypothetical protein [Neisseria sp.]|uniref:hypothetical protein n=1 Tax=Neisseria sp. TaxID=192066 RepID=UPI0035A00FD7